MSDWRCGTCKYYTESEYSWRNGYCLKFDSGFMRDATFTAVASIDTLADCRLEVTRDFGCVLHEPKPPEADPAEG